MGQVTLKDVYEITNRIEDKLDKMDGRVSVLEVWKADIMGKMAILGAILIFASNFLIDWLKNSVFKKI